MKLTAYHLKIKILAASLSLLVFGCEEERQQDNFAMLTGTAGLTGSADLVVVSSTPVQNQSGVGGGEKIRLVFSRPIHSGRCISAFTLDDARAGAFNTALNALEFTPTAAMTAGTHSVAISTDCEDLAGKDLLTPFSLSFTVALPAAPLVQAVGLESQGCPDAYPGTGSAAGGDHSLGSCWWDGSLPVLSPTSYEFRGGDDGTGAAGFANACADVKTDNFRLIFSQYMDIDTTTAAVSLTRLSPPGTLIKLATHRWSDCQNVAPFGCRSLTLVYSEAEATCNGTINFGTNALGGDFNLSQSNAPQVSDFPLYRLDVAKTARTIEGITLENTFSFTMEAN